MAAPVFISPFKRFALLMLSTLTYGLSIVLMAWKLTKPRESAIAEMNRRHAEAIRAHELAAGWSPGQWDFDEELERSLAAQAKAIRERVLEERAVNNASGLYGSPPLWWTEGHKAARAQELRTRPAGSPPRVISSCTREEGFKFHYYPEL